MTSDTPAPAPQPRTPLPPWVWVALAFGLPAILFVTTACRTLYVGDAGDFATACWTLGIAHPPGYPLYTLLGWLWCQLPIPGGETEVAWRLNLMSSLFGAGTCGLVYLVLVRLGKVPLLALLGSLAVAVSRAFWWQASITEVYTLNTFFLLWQWWLALRYIETGSRKHWHWLLVALSLALAHHYSILMFYPFMAWFIWRERGTLWPADSSSAGAPVKPKLASELVQMAALLILPMLTLYLYLLAVDFKTPVSAERQKPYSNTQEMISYALRDIILRDVYTNKAQFENPTTSWQVAGYYWRYVMGDPFRQWDLFESGDQGTLALGILLALWTALLWRANRSEDLPTELNDAPDLIRLRHHTRLFLGALALFAAVVCLVPSGDILGAPQTNLRVVLPPLLVPGHLFLVLAIFAGAIAFWHHLAEYVWRGRAKDPMDPAKKLALSRGLLALVLAILVVVNGYNNWPIGNRSGSFIAWSYVNNVIRSTPPDTFVLNTGDETFLYWYMDKVHWDLHPEERPDRVTFANWIHLIPSFEVLAQGTEAELQRDIIAYCLRNQMVERAARALGAETDQPYQANFATTFMRPEFLQVPFFRYWNVELDGLVYHWEPQPEYIPIIIQNILQTNEEEAEWDRLDPSALMVLQQYLIEYLYDTSPLFASRVNSESGREATGGGAAARADITELGPLRPDETGILRGPVPSEQGAADPGLLTLSDDTGRIVYQMPQTTPLELTLAERDWWEFYDWRGVLTLTATEFGVMPEPPKAAFDAQEEEILARFQDLFIQHAIKHYRAATEARGRLDAAGGSKAGTAEALEAEQDVLNGLLEADQWASIAIKMPFIYHPDMAMQSWGLMGDIKLSLGQIPAAVEAFRFLMVKLDPSEFPLEASRVRANLALALDASGERRQAERLVTEALVLDPGNPLALQLQERWRGAGSPGGAAPGSGFTIREEGEEANEKVSRFP